MKKTSLFFGLSLNTFILPSFVAAQSFSGIKQKYCRGEHWSRIVTMGINTKYQSKFSCMCGWSPKSLVK